MSPRQAARERHESNSVVPLSDVQAKVLRTLRDDPGRLKWITPPTRIWLSNRNFIKVKELGKGKREFEITDDGRAILAEHEKFIKEMLK